MFWHWWSMHGTGRGKKVVESYCLLPAAVMAQAACFDTWVYAVQSQCSLHATCLTLTVYAVQSQCSLRATVVAQATRLTLTVYARKRVTLFSPRAHCLQLLRHNPHVIWHWQSIQEKGVQDCSVPMFTACGSCCGMVMVSSCKVERRWAGRHWGLAVHCLQPSW